MTLAQNSQQKAKDAQPHLCAGNANYNNEILFHIFSLAEVKSLDNIKHLQKCKKMAAPIPLKSVNQYNNFESHLVMLSEAEKEMAAHSSILAWRTPRTEETGRLQSMGSQRVINNCATHKHTHTHSEAEDASILPMANIPECPCTLNPKRCAYICRFYYCL